MKFEVVQETAVGSYVWKLVANDGSAIATSAVFATAAEALQSIDAVKKWSASAPVNSTSDRKNYYLNAEVAIASATLFC